MAESNHPVYEDEFVKILSVNMAKVEGMDLNSGQVGSKVDYRKKVVDADSSSGGEDDEEELDSVNLTSNTQQREVHYYHHHHYNAPVYHGVAEYIIGTKAEVKDTHIQSIGASASQDENPTHNAISGPHPSIQVGKHPALGWQEELGAIGGIPDISEAASREISTQTDERPTKDADIQLTLITDQSATAAKILIDAAEEIALKEKSDKSLQFDLLLTLYRNEETKISEKMREKYNDLQPALEQVWNKIRNNAIAAAYERHLVATHNPNDLRDRLLSMCYEMAKQNLTKADDTDILSKYTSRTDDVFDMGKDFASGEHFIHAAMTFYLNSKLHQLINNGDTSVHGIRSCVYQVRLVVESMTKTESMKKVVLDHVIPLMREMMGFIQNIRCSSRVKVINEAWCLCRIALSYGNCDENQQFAETNETAIDLIRRELKEEANTCELYGLCLNNCAAAYGRMGNTDKAIEKYRMALEVYEKVKWESEERKNEEISRTRRNLEKRLKKLRK